jgi:hypothetical protein
MINSWATAQTATATQKIEVAAAGESQESIGEFMTSEN